MEITPLDEDELTFALLKESDLDNHLRNGNKEKKAEEKVEKKTDLNNDDKTEQPLAVTDYQLNEALNLLKGLHIASQSSTAM